MALRLNQIFTWFCQKKINLKDKSTNKIQLTDEKNNPKNFNNSVVCKIWERPQWMVPKPLTHFFESVQPKAKVV